MRDLHKDGKKAAYLESLKCSSLQTYKHVIKLHTLSTIVHVHRSREEFSSITKFDLKAPKNHKLSVSIFVFIVCHLTLTLNRASPRRILGRLAVSANFCVQGHFLRIMADPMQEKTALH